MIKDTDLAYGVDFETYYKKEVYTMQSHGAYGYTHDPRFDAYAVAISGPGVSYVGPPEEAPWRQIAGAVWVAHNAPFDRAVWERLVERGDIFDGPPAAWRDTAGTCALHGLPRSLAGAVKELLGRERDKSIRDNMSGRDGRELFQDPELDAYALQDAVDCLEIWHALRGITPSHEIRLMESTYQVGRRGIACEASILIDYLETLDRARMEIEDSLPWTPEYRPASVDGLATACEALGVPAPESTAVKSEAFHKWSEIHSEALPYVHKVQRWRRVNKLRALVSTMRERIRPDGRLDFSLVYHQAGPGRWAGGDGLNMQALNAEATEGVDLRAALVAPPGKRLVIVDLSQIEPRLLFWLSGDAATLELISSGVSVYEAHARQTMGYQGEGLLKEARPKLYKGAKARVLGLGYGCGAETYVTLARNLAGLTLTEDQARFEVDDYRATNPLIVGLWESLEARFDSDRAARADRTLLPLPGGRTLRYWHDYEAHKKVERAAAARKGGRSVSWWGGKLTENLIQGVARDFFGERLLDIEAAGIGSTVLHCHDEIVLEVDADNAADALKETLHRITRPSPWLPLSVPIAASGEVAECYTK